MKIALTPTGKISYQEAATEEPIYCQIPAEQAKEWFTLADKLDRFKRPLEAPVKVANMGQKTLRYEESGSGQETNFNYTQDLDAQRLVDWFEKVTETEQHFFNLERTARFDKLGVNKYLLQLQATMDRGRLVAPEQFLPLLDKVAKNESYLHMARERAASMAQVIRDGNINVEKAAP